MDLGLKGRKAIVSAASRGLGLAAARSLAREGVSLIMNARSAEALEKSAADIRSEFGVEVTTVAADFNSAEGRKQILDAAGDVDILVNNPGVRQVPTPYAKISAEDWRYWMETHFLSSLEMITAVAPGMQARKFGRIVNMSVSFIKFPQVGFAHSHAARLALSGAVAAMVRELMPDNVTINTVCPGLFDTDALHTNLHGHAKRGNTTYEAIVENRLSTCPAGRFADPSECGDLIAFLCSAQSGFMSGQNIVNDGGVYQGLF
ncbi:SDR family oxidoreductase [Hoeflea alexandrii]|jgi:3-oxoacyl-[acyl-carrier protein] reductase|uniref:SDR family oxidoreductase n=1 Tax=Hoeflea alexandrii TaxID=288436 RepID=A0ABT1CSX0_9HYPH|nr:SDR family oxidoreductase [Hoeflea alexandrii]MBV6649256.1 SDR family oxidoreductase [Hoeflea sp.]MCO6409292.1 SDR family oxidoreductase [Hoeflea alexandrii]MCY0151893.1 SDR family oxidoreductase [Hoeflea alexandrii]